MADPQAQPTEPTQPAGGQQAASVQAQPTQEAKFTQADLERHINERLTREREKYKDYDELKAKAETLESASKSELEKAIEKANRAEARQKEMETQTRERVITAEAKAIAAELGFTKPDRAIKLADMANAKYNEDGTVSGIREALTALAMEMPELLAKKSAPNTGASNPAKTEGGESEAQRILRSRSGGGFNQWLGAGKLQVNTAPGTKQKGQPLES